MEYIETNYIDRRFEILRLKDKAREKAILESIMQKGLSTPVKGVKYNNRLILIDGFKRVRSADKLQISRIPFISTGEDEISGLLEIIRLSGEHKLTTFEEAVMINQLYKKYALSMEDIANRVEKSKAWVSVRLNILNEMSEKVKEALLKGKFPVRSYMYTLRQFTRVNYIPKKEIDKFVEITSGENYSTRDIEVLAYGYFRGNEELKQQIEEGNCNYTLRILKEQRKKNSDFNSKLNKKEQTTLRDLEITGKYINRLLCELESTELKSNEFYVNADIVVKGIIDKIKSLKLKLEDFCDKRGNKANCKNSSQRRER